MVKISSSFVVFLENTNFDKKFTSKIYRSGNFESALLQFEKSLDQFGQIYLKSTCKIVGSGNLDNFESTLCSTGRHGKAVLFNIQSRSDGPFPMFHGVHVLSDIVDFGCQIVTT